MIIIPNYFLYLWLRVERRKMVCITWNDSFFLLASSLSLSVSACRCGPSSFMRMRELQTHRRNNINQYVLVLGIAFITLKTAWQFRQKKKVWSKRTTATQENTLSLYVFSTCNNFIGIFFSSFVCKCIKMCSFRSFYFFYFLFRSVH